MNAGRAESKKYILDRISSSEDVVEILKVIATILMEIEGDLDRIDMNLNK